MNIKFDGLTLLCGNSPEELYATLDRLYDNLNDAGCDSYWGGDSYVTYQGPDGRSEWGFSDVYRGLYWAQQQGAPISIPVAMSPGPLDTFERFMVPDDEDYDMDAREVYHWAVNWKPSDAR